jgi:hypothetical protein
VSHIIWEVSERHGLDIRSRRQIEEVRVVEEEKEGSLGWSGVGVYDV